MILHTAKLVIANKRDSPREIIIEPWADEYILAPKSIMTLISVDNEDHPYFHIEDKEKYLIIFVEGSHSYFIIQDDRRIVHMGDCGESKGIEQDIEELRIAGELGTWLKD